MMPAAGAVPPGYQSAPMWDIRDIASILWRRLLWLVLPAVLLATAAIAYVMLTPARYDAKATLLIDPRGMQVVDRTLEPARNSGEESLALVESQLRVLTSDATLQRLIERERLVDDEEFGRPPAGVLDQVKGWIGDAVGIAPRETDVRLATLDRLRRAVRAERGPGSYIVDVYVRAEDPDKAARLANAIADIFIAEDRAVRSNASGRVGNELSGQLEGLKQQVQDADQKIEAFKTANGLVSARGNLIGEQKLAEVSNQLVQARLKTQEAQSRVEQITAALKSGGGADAIGDPVASPTISALRVRLAAARQAEAQLLASLRPAHPSVQAAQASIRSIASQIRTELARIGDTARGELARATSTEAQVAASEEKLRREVERTGSATVALRELERERDSLRKVYEGFLVRVRELGGQSSVDTSNSRLYSRATPPQRKSGPGLMVLLPGTLAAGLVIGTLLALLVEQLAMSRPAMAQLAAPEARARRTPRDLTGVEVAAAPAVSPQQGFGDGCYHEGDALRRPPAAAAHTPLPPATRPFTPHRPAPTRPLAAVPQSTTQSTTRREWPAMTTMPRTEPDLANVTVIERGPRIAASAAAQVPASVVSHEPPIGATRGDMSTSAASRGDMPMSAAPRGGQPPGAKIVPTRFRPTLAFRRVPLLGVLGAAGYRAEAVRDIVFADPASTEADAFFSAAYLLASAARSAPARLVVVTASAGSKSSALGAFNLALASTASGERVLLIDADLSQRRLSRTLVPAAVRGLADVVDGHLTFADATWNDPETFDLVPASGLLRRRIENDRLAHTIASAVDATSGYTRIIVDAGALGEGGADGGAERLARAADAVILMTPVADAAAPVPVVRPTALDPVGDALVGAIGVVGA